MIATVIASWSGTNNAASANGIGVAPITAAAAAAAEAPAETEAAGSQDDAPESAQAEPLDDEPAAPKDESGGE